MQTQTSKSALTPRFVVVIALTLLIMFQSYRLVDLLDLLVSIPEQMYQIIKLSLQLTALPFFIYFTSSRETHKK